MSRLPANATVLSGGKRTGTGYHFQPTVIDGVFQSDEVVCDEIFGPVVTVQPFATEEEAIELANGTKYALASSVWSNNHGVVTRVSNELDFGSVWINCHQVIPAEAPHGGFKHSGHRQGPLRLRARRLHPHQVRHHLPPLKPTLGKP